MARTKCIADNNGGTNVALTEAEEIIRDAEELVWTNAKPTREMTLIRKHRDNLLTETDWMANSDVTMSDAWKTYRQKLRDIPASNTVYENVTWPTQPA